MNEPVPENMHAFGKVIIESGKKDSISASFMRNEVVIFVDACQTCY